MRTAVPFGCIAKILFFLLLSKLLNYFFCYLLQYFCFPSRTLFIIMCVLYRFPFLHSFNFAPLQHICSQSRRRIRRLRRPARRGVCVAIGARIKKKIFVGMCVSLEKSKKNNQQISPHWVIADCFKASNVKLNITCLQLPHSWRALQTRQAVRH